MKHRMVVVVVLVLCAALIKSAPAQEPAYKDILAKLDVTDAITPDSTDLLGDRIDLFTGSLSFYHTDVSLPGNNGLTVAVGRTYRGVGYSYRHGAEFGDWALNIPSISTVDSAKPRLNNTYGWKDKRCSGDAASGGSALTPGPAESSAPSTGHWTDEENFWNGVHLNTPDGQTRKVLEDVRHISDPGDPQSFVKFPNDTALATKDLWKITCISDIGDGTEGFVATSPSGVTYTFDKLIILPASILLTGGYIYPRKTYLMVATKVEDLWGNYVNYNYTGTQLTSIIASDDRTISLNYNANAQVSSVVAASKTWTYTYDGANRLQSVTLPDLRQWQFALNGIGALKPLTNSGNPELCAVSDGLRRMGTGSITHPNGLVGTFEVEEKTHGRTQIQYFLLNGSPTMNKCFDTVSLKKKTLTGPGISSLVWEYIYDENLGSYDNEPPASDTRTLTVKAPDNSKTVYHHDRSYTWKEGALVKTEVKTATDVVVQTVINDVLQGPYVGWYDLAYQNVTSDGRPKRDDKTTIQVNGDSYFIDNVAYDGYLNATQILRNNSINANWSITETQTFSNDMTDWVLGMPLLQTVNSTTTSENQYCLNSTSPCKKHKLMLAKSFGATKATFEYGSDATVSRILDGVSNAYQFSNYKRGIPQAITLPGSLSISASVNDDGTVASKTNPKSHTYSYDYDFAGRLANIEYPLELNQTYWADSAIEYEIVDSTDLAIPNSGLVAGQWKQVITRGDYRKTSFLDALFRTVLIREEDLTDTGLTRYTRQTWNHDNRITFTSYSSINANEALGVTTVYDALGRTVSVADPSGTTTSVYVSGNKIQVTNPRNKVTTTTYQAFGSPAYDAPTLIVQPLGVTTTIVRDDFGKMTSATQGDAQISATRTYQYDTRQQLCRTYDPEIGYTDFYFDNADNLKWELRASTTDYCDSGNTGGPSTATKFTYDGQNRITLKDYPSGTTDLGFGYDPNGNVTSVSRGGVVWTYDYNSLDLANFERLNLESKQFEAWYIYDTIGNVMAIDYPSGRIIDVLPNAFGQSTQVGTYISGVGHHPSGALSTFRYGQPPNGKIFTQAENSSRLPSSMAVPGITSLSYSYDANKNVSAIADAVIPLESRSMTYDDLDRLYTANGPWGSGSFSYDALGNIKIKALGPLSYAFNYDANNLLDTVTGSKAYQFSYDSHGNVDGNGHQSFTYDKANNLLAVNSGAVATYNYDAHNRRVSVEDASGKVYQFYSQNGKLLFKSKASNNEPSDYLYLAGKQVAKIGGVPGPQAPLTPAFITVPEENDSGSFSVTWQAVSGATSYTLQEYKDSAGWTTVYTGSTTSKAFTGKTTGNYQYRVLAANANGSSSYRDSRFFDVEIVGPPPSPPSWITSPDWDKDGNFTVSWNASTGATSYTLEDNRNNAGWNVEYTGPNTSHSAHWIIGYWDFRVKACNANGCSGWSGISSTEVSKFPGQN